MIAHDEKLLAELSPDVWGTERHRLFNIFKLPNLERLSGLTAVVSTPEASSNYSHWMVDLLPRLQLLRRAGFGPRQIDRYLINLGGFHYERETLELAGIPWEKVLPVGQRSHFRCAEVVTTSLRQRHWQFSLPNWVPGYLKGLVLTEPSTKLGRRLYLTRRHAAFRRVVNEDELLPILHAYGFEVFDPGSRSVREQAEVFAEASAIVSPHGSALTNLVFAPSGTVVLEIHSADYHDVSFWTAASAINARYYAFVGERVGKRCSSTIEARRQDIRVPPTLLKEFCETVLGHNPMASVF